ncbi:hypothetical protein K438DRAFT_1787631 [Mycena galopus ATCC 62051]|nr:hypothetical protein K438DRAFT_1787631 [Mycena galopus ATCC 62051]
MPSLKAKPTSSAKPRSCPVLPEHSMGEDRDKDAGDEDKGTPVVNLSAHTMQTTSASTPSSASNLRSRTTLPSAPGSPSHPCSHRHALSTPQKGRTESDNERDLDPDAEEEDNNNSHPTSITTGIPLKIGPPRGAGKKKKAAAPAPESAPAPEPTPQPDPAAVVEEHEEPGPEPTPEHEHSPEPKLYLFPQFPPPNPNPSLSEKWMSHRFRFSNNPRQRDPLDSLLPEDYSPSITSGRPTPEPDTSLPESPYTNDNDPNGALLNMDKAGDGRLHTRARMTSPPPIVTISPASDSTRNTSPEEDEPVPIPPRRLGLGGASHRERNPLAPQQPVKPSTGGKARRKEGSSALEGTKNARAAVLKESRSKLKERVQEFRNGMEKEVKAVAAELELDVKEVDKSFRAVSGYKQKRGLSIWDAKVWRKAKEVNAGKPAGQRLRAPEIQELVRKDDKENPLSKEESSTLMAEYKAYKDALDKGTRVSNKEAAQDVGWVVEKVYDDVVTDFEFRMKLLNMEARTGAGAFMVTAGANVTDTIMPACVGSEMSLAFCSKVLKMTPTELAGKFAAFLQLQEPDVIESSFTKKRTALVGFLKEGLQTITKKAKIQMEYLHYDLKIIVGEGVILRGWPDRIPFLPPSNAGSGGSENITELLKLKQQNVLHWDKATAKEIEAARKRIEANPKPPRKRRTQKKGRKDSDDGDDSGDNDEEQTPTKRKAKASTSGPKVPKRKRDDSDDEESAKDTDNSTDEGSPLPAKKKRRLALPTPSKKVPRKSAITKDTAPARHKSTKKSLSSSSKKVGHRDAAPQKRKRTEPSDTSGRSRKKAKSAALIEDSDMDGQEQALQKAGEAETSKALAELMARRKVKAAGQG